MSQDSIPFHEVIEETLESLAPGELIIGNISAISDNGEPLVEFSLNRSGKALVALSTLSITHQHVGRSVALMFNEGNLQKPIIVGLIHSPLHELIENFELSSAEAEVNEAVEAPNDTTPQLEKQAVVDGERVVIEGREEIVLKCGESSISLHKSGKIMIRGKYLLNRATGVNRILGGSVQVN